MANRRFEVTDTNRDLVRKLALAGIPHLIICDIIGCSLPTLSKYFRDILTHAKAQANAEVAQTLYNMARSGRHAAASIFWAKSQMGWRETGSTEEVLGAIIDVLTEHLGDDPAKIIDISRALRERSARSTG